ncbi:MAG: CoA transferase, partial [Actinomycetes bacterium]
REHPLVVDLTSLWAGPLCAHLLGRLGARVVKVESTTRPDGARLGPPAFFELLHAGHEAVRLDFASQRDQLRDLVASADLVLEASRPRAPRQLGLDAADIVAGGACGVSITARGRDSDAVGFGDDVAAAAGLVVRDRDDVLPAGDALADPLAGVAAAVAAQEALAGEEAQLIDVSMLHVAAEAAGGEGPEHQVVRRGDEWLVEYAGGAIPVASPRRRRAGE